MVDKSFRSFFLLQTNSTVLFKNYALNIFNATDFRYMIDKLILNGFDIDYLPDTENYR